MSGALIPLEDWAPFISEVRAGLAGLPESINTTSGHRVAMSYQRSNEGDYVILSGFGPTAGGGMSVIEAEVAPGVIVPLYECRVFTDNNEQGGLHDR